MNSKTSDRIYQTIIKIDKDSLLGYLNGIII